MTERIFHNYNGITPLAKNMSATLLINDKRPQPINLTSLRHKHHQLYLKSHSFPPQRISALHNTTSLSQNMRK